MSWASMRPTCLPSDALLGQAFRNPSLKNAAAGGQKLVFFAWVPLSRLER